MAIVNFDLKANDQVSGAAKSAKASVDGLKTSVEGGSKSLANMVKPAVASGDAMKGVMDASKAALGPMGGMFEKVNLLKGAFTGGGGMYAGIALATVAVLALSAAVVVGVAKLAVLAVTLNKVAMAKIDSISKEAEKNFAALFSGVHVDKFTKALGDVAGMLGKNSAAAQGLKAIIELILNPIFDAIPVLVPLVKSFFYGMVVGALMVTLEAIKLRNAIRDIIPESVKNAWKDLTSKIDTAKTAFTAGMIAVGALGVALALLTVLLGIIAVAMFMAFLPLIILGAVVLIAIAAVIAIFYGLYQAVVYIGSAIMEFGGMASDALNSLVSAAGDAASGFIDGLVNGITSGASSVISAVTNLADNVVNAAKNALGIHSPSTVFAAIGGNITEGVAGGVDRGADKAVNSVRTATQDMATAGAGAAGTGASGTNSSSSIPSVQAIVNIEIANSPGGSVSDLGSEIGRRVEEAMFNVMSKLAAQGT